MKKILITSALALELNIVKKEIKNLSFKGLKLDFLLTGVGNYNVIYSIKNYIENKGKPDFLINLGVCGKKGKEISDDFFQVYRIKNKANKKESLIPIYFSFLELRSLLSSEEVITSADFMLGEDYVDMESYGTDFVCNKEHIPCIVLKKPFDLVGKDSKNVDLKDLEKSLENFDYKRILEKALAWLEENKTNKKDLEKYKNHFRFTFSELEIFKKNYNKFLAYNLDFLDFFEKNKTLNKKEFLTKMTKK